MDILLAAMAFSVLMVAFSTAVTGLTETYLRITALRAKFREKGVEYKVVKNTLVVKALEGTDLGKNEELAGHLKGMTGIAWSYEDPSAAAKVIKAFRKGDVELADSVYSGVPAHMVGLEQKIAVGPMAGKSNAAFVLERLGIEPSDDRIQKVLAAGKSSKRLLTDEEVRAASS